MFNGDIKRKPVKIKKKITKEAFENYMKMYFEVESKVKVCYCKDQFDLL